MRFPYVNRANVCVSLVALAAIVAGCGGGGGSSSLPRPVTATTAPVSQSGSAKATFVITWPAPGSAAQASVRRISARVTNGTRKPDFVSASTTSLTISVNGGTATPITNPNIGTTSTFTPTTTVTVDAPVGVDTFAVNDYDATPNLLASNSIMQNIVIDSANVVNITLNGNLAKLLCAPVAPYVTGTDAALTETGPSGQISITPEDADGNIIVSPGIVPTLALAGDGTTGTAAPTSTQNVFTINTMKVGTAVLYAASGQNLAGTTITHNCSVTRQLAMYVSNHFKNEAGSTTAGGTQDASVTVYPASAAASATPIATIQGASTLLAGTQFIAVDSKGYIFVTNQGPMPGATFGPTSGFVSIYAPGSNGNVAPVSTIPNLNTPEGITFDKNGMLYVLSIDRINEYLPTSDGAPATLGGTPVPAAVNSQIIGSNTDLYSCYGLAVGVDLTVYSACSDVMNGYPAGSTGNAAPGEIFVVGQTAMSFASDSWIGVSIDSAGNIALPDSNNNGNNVEIYTESQVPAPGATAIPVPTMNTGVGLSQPYGVTTDVNGKYYVVNYGNNSIEEYTSITTFEAGVGTNIPLTGLNAPYGIAVI